MVVFPDADAGRFQQRCRLSETRLLGLQRIALAPGGFGAADAKPGQQPSLADDAGETPIATDHRQVAIAHAVHPVQRIDQGCRHVDRF